MNKETFLHQLRIRLSQLPESEIQKRLDYYEELIEDMKDDGITEEDAVAGFGEMCIRDRYIPCQISAEGLLSESRCRYPLSPAWTADFRPYIWKCCPHGCISAHWRAAVR